MCNIKHKKIYLRISIPPKAPPPRVLMASLLAAAAVAARAVDESSVWKWFLNAACWARAAPFWVERKEATAWLLPELKAKAEAAPREAMMTERLNFMVDI